jgi:hypothetical protein
VNFGALAHWGLLRQKQSINFRMPDELPKLAVYADILR